MPNSIFISSTFIDLEIHRKLVFKAISKLECKSDGMEFFGALPETPKEECLRLVRSANIYIGIFGMRYGAVDKKSGKSLTQLEYEEAKSINLPSLIYILDENNHAVLPKFVDTGSSAEMLKDLKSSLKHSHVVNFFISPDDLAEKVTNDLSNLIDGLSKEPSAQVLSQIANNSVKRHPLTQVRFEFLNENIKSHFDYIVPDAIMREAVELILAGDNMAASFVISRGTPMPLNDAIDGLMKVQKVIEEFVHKYQINKSCHHNMQRAWRVFSHTR